MVVGVNGGGKTTTVGKLAHKFIGSGAKVMLGSGDTFRAAAFEQLQTWGERTGAVMGTYTEGSRPAKVRPPLVGALCGSVLLLDRSVLLRQRSSSCRRGASERSGAVVGTYTERSRPAKVWLSWHKLC